MKNITLHTLQNAKPKKGGNDRLICADSDEKHGLPVRVFYWPPSTSKACSANSLRVGQGIQDAEMSASAPPGR